MSLRTQAYVRAWWLAMCRPSRSKISQPNIEKDMALEDIFFSGVQDGAPRYPSWFITPITMVYGSYNYSYWGL